MHMTSILSGLTMAMAVTASPIIEARTDNPQPPACGSPSGGFQPKCCQNVVSSILSALNLGIGVGCVDLVGGQCQQEITCCAPGTQYGLINVQLVCVLNNV